MLDANNGRDNSTPNKPTTRNWIINSRDRCIHRRFNSTRREVQRVRVPILSLINYFTEGSAVVVGAFLLTYGVLYYQYFESWFFRSLTIIGGITVICALLDLITQKAPKIKVSKRLIGQRDKYVVLKD